MLIIDINYVDAENSYFYVDHVNITDDVISCALVNYTAGNLSCVIQAIFKLNEGNCSSYHLDYANQNLISMSSTSVSIAHLPRNQLFCFVAEGKNLTFTVVITGTFRTHAGCGINFIQCRAILPYLAFLQVSSMTWHPQYVKSLSF